MPMPMLGVAAQQEWQVPQKHHAQADDNSSSNSAISHASASPTAGRQWPAAQQCAQQAGSPRSSLSSAESAETTRHDGRDASIGGQPSPSRASHRLQRKRRSFQALNDGANRSPPSAGANGSLRWKHAAVASEEATAAVTEARLKAARAVRLVAVAQHLARQEAAAPAAMPRRRAARRVISFAMADNCSEDDFSEDDGDDASDASDAAEVLAASPRKRVARGGLQPLLGARVAVLRDAGDGTQAFCKGEVKQVDGLRQRCHIEYDTGAKEWTSLQQRRFRWLGPRAASAGCSLAMKAGMVQASALNAAGEVPVPEAASPAPPAGTAAVGGRVSVLFVGDGQQHAAWVLAYDREIGRHHLLYEDGEDEWADLAADSCAWGPPPPAAGATHGGLAPGTAPPDGEGAVGWQLAVYWKEDSTFYRAACSGWDASAGTHLLQYEDGESECLTLADEAVKWLVAPLDTSHSGWAASKTEAGGHVWLPVGGGDAAADAVPQPPALAAQQWGVPATIMPAVLINGSGAGNAGRAVSPALIAPHLLGPCSLPGRGSPRLPFTSGSWDASRPRATLCQRLATASADSSFATGRNPAPEHRSTSAADVAAAGGPSQLAHSLPELASNRHIPATCGDFCSILCHDTETALEESLCGSPPADSTTAPMLHGGKGLLSPFRSISVPGPPPLGLQQPPPPPRSISMPSLALAADDVTTASPDCSASVGGWGVDMAGGYYAVMEELDLNPSLDFQPDLEGLLQTFAD